eukprot:CAMPEP_0196661002 /NCGR_PEP_ID=MMETSP1086-20130531/42138_1 /TAXON_ID=77921 /ORGANISM="Cyanoptyche  gloeocystis , Strain SAG4.97" /LENGTH=204 /DNA_ID=CAMNT_0041995687 /DNA_START=94 /DNA_END=708 /DNA_ORIENTATION=-
MAFGWLWMDYLIASNLDKVQKPESFWTSCEKAIKIFQTLSILEVFHSVLGLVKSPTLPTALQVAGRMTVLWLVADLAAETRDTPFLSMMLISWSLVEVPRYSYYALNLVGKTPYAILWLRYSLFLLLYPFGIAGEIGVILKALPYIRAHDVFKISLPNSANFSFDYYYFLLFALIAYLPAGPFMYRHMIHQRRKYLSSIPKKKD